MGEVEDSLLDRATALLRSRPGQGICVSCLAEALARSSARIRSVAERLDALEGVTRSFGTCAICEKERLLLRAE